MHVCSTRCWWTFLYLPFSQLHCHFSFRTKWGPFQQVGPHEDQVLNWGPLCTHCIRRFQACGSISAKSSISQPNLTDIVSKIAYNTSPQDFQLQKSTLALGQRIRSDRNQITPWILSGKKLAPEITASQNLAPSSLSWTWLASAVGT